MNRNGTKRGEVVIAGGGLAGQRFCETLRRRGHDGPIRMICAEPVRPYDRPPLSKELLAGDVHPDTAFLRPDRWYEDNAVDLVLGRRAESLDLAARSVTLDTGEELGFGCLLIATGSEPRLLPGAHSFANVHTLRTLADMHALSNVLRDGARIAIVGAGFIGLEVAATARRLGAEVTLIEAAPAPLAGVLGQPLGEWFARLHRDEGVQLELGARIARFSGNGRVERIDLERRASVECDAVLIGIGVLPATRWLAGSGLDAADGVRVDQFGRSAAAGVLAAGDAALTLDPVSGDHVRGDHWESAVREARLAAHAALEVTPPGAPLASFWSDQYGSRIQYIGRHRPGDELAIDGDPAARDFSAVWKRAGRPVAALLVGRPNALAEWRRTLAASRHSQPDQGDEHALPADSG
jgi:3-phenylpropionate/trans-cinnamate dioxygenase ferredoxin reductase component